MPNCEETKVMLRTAKTVHTDGQNAVGASERIPEVVELWSASSAPATAVSRPSVRGKFLFVGDEKLYVRGVTYGTFRPGEDGSEYQDPQTVERDFAQMAGNGVNAVRTYTVPPRWLLDIAQRHGLYVMVGLPWEQHIAFLDDKESLRSIEERVRTGVRSCAGHPAVLCYAIGNEIPAPIVRWHGHRRVERWLKRLYRAVKAEDPGSLVTYVNYPSTEYLNLPFVDFVSFNVYLEQRERLEAYLARLQNIVGDRPLVMAEIGLDSYRNGCEQQAHVLDWQIRTVFAAGCAGMFVFAWTDEWHRGGLDVEDWDFGLVRRDRVPKPALDAVRKAFAEVPFPADQPWPRISVVVCSYNGARTIRDCLKGLQQVAYPDFEVIVVDDGSTDATAKIAAEYPVRLISIPNGGLSNARNIGLEAATGEIVAYLDDDAWPDPQWLTYLAATFMSTDYAGVGGPNIPPPGQGSIADCIANAPGGPVHVLLSDREAEHIPGCNAAFRKTCLQAIGGFDPQFRVAGDDVDVCWRLQQQGWTLGFSPAALVWHHRRHRVRAYWKQQRGYGKAEALLEKKWPEKYNSAGHLTWTGRIYGKGITRMLSLRPKRIYQGTWGSALFQSVYQPAVGVFSSLPLMPEWYLIAAVLAVFAGLGFVWEPLRLALPLLILVIATSLIQAGLSATHASFTSRPNTGVAYLKLWSLTTLLHLLQPLARLSGRLRWGLTPWRSRGAENVALPWPRTSTISSKQWRAPEARLQAVETALRASGLGVLRGGDYDRWDLEVPGGLLGAIRVRMATEEHGTGHQFIRFGLWPKCSLWGIGLVSLFAVLAIDAVRSRVWLVAAILGVAALLLGLRLLLDCGVAMAALLGVLERYAAANRVNAVPALPQVEVRGAYSAQVAPLDLVKED